MPRYFYHIYGDAGSPDDVGVDLVDLRAAQREAINFTSEVLRDEHTKLVHHKHWQLDVTDDAGIILFQVEVNLIEGSALHRDPLVRS